MKFGDFTKYYTDHLRSIHLLRKVSLKYEQQVYGEELPHLVETHFHYVQKVVNVELTVNVQTEADKIHSRVGEKRPKCLIRGRRNHSTDKCFYEIT